MLSPRIFVIALTAVLLFQLCPSIAAAQDLTPSEVHEILARGKAEALGRARSAQAAAMVAPPHDQTQYDVKFYDVAIRVNDTTQILYGTVKFVAAATVDNLLSIAIDFYSGMTIDGIAYPSGSLTYSRTGDFVAITLDRLYDAGEQFEFDIAYHGHPPTGGLQAFSFDTFSGDPSISSLSEPYFAHTWWPCKDRMDDKPDSLDSHIEVDTGLYCASNGVLDSITTLPGSNSRTFHRRVRYPMATYLFSVAIAPFVVWQNTYTALDGVTTMPVVHHVYPDFYAMSLGTWGQTPNFIHVLASVYGEYPFLDEKYGHANFEWGGAMEHQTVTSMGGGAFGFTTWVIVHELSHQWWGDMITCKSWHDIWLNEGWATYSEALYTLETEGWAAYHDYMNSIAYFGTGSVYCTDTTSVSRIFSTNLSYHKGAWVVHMLRGVLGETLFQQGIEGYYNSAYQYKALTTNEFNDLWEATTGQELSWFFEDWVFGQGYPNYRFAYMVEPSDGGGYDIYLVVGQEQTTYPQVFRMPVDFYFEYAGGVSDTVTLLCDERQKRFKFNNPNALDHIELDPSGWVLKGVNSLPWTYYIITNDGELSSGIRLEQYRDTIETRGGTNTVFSIVDGSLPDGLTIDNLGVISGIPTVEGTFQFTAQTTDLTSSQTDQEDYAITIGPDRSCCEGQVGDINGENGDEPTVGDISTLIDFLFITREPLACYPEADVNLSGGYLPDQDDISIGDISMLIDHLFISLAPLSSCP